MSQSPRTRRLRSDQMAMERLLAESSIFRYKVARSLTGGPPESYLVRFLGPGTWKDELGNVRIRDEHEVSIHLVSSYPRSMPELQWRTPVYHPNISASGIVCLGGYSTHWVPSLGLDDLCQMLWDMIRYQNFDVDSPYNREAAHWARTQTDYRLPLDPRPLRNLTLRPPPGGSLPADLPSPSPRASLASVVGEVVFLDNQAATEVIEAEIVESADQDILFLD